MSTLPETSSTPARNPLVPAVLIGLSAMFLFCGYEFIRSTGSTLFKQTYTMKGLPYVMAIMPFGVLGMLYVYGRLLTRFGPRRTLLLTSLISVAGIVACHALIVQGQDWARGALYIHREAYVILVVEQYWSFLNSTLDKKHARWLNGPICGIGSIGSFAGGKMLAAYSPSFDVETMLLIGAALTVPAVIFSDIAYRVCGEPTARREEPHARGSLGLSLFKKRSMLLLLLIVVIATQVISTSMEVAWQGKMQQDIPDPKLQNAYSGNVFADISIAAAIGQFVLAPLSLWLLPNWGVHLALPLLNLSALIYAGSKDTLSGFGFAYQTFKTIDYSLFRAAKELLYIPLSFDERYRAKELIDVWGYRFSKGATSALIALLGLTLAPTLNVSIGIGAAAVWMVVMATLLWNERKTHSSDDVGSSPRP
jgi:AAA family ATP:ADP antiporter